MRAFQRCVMALALVLALAFTAWGPTLAAAAAISLDDGSYLVEVSMTGGTGRAHISSPTTLTVTDGQAIARIEWSSPHYDYMLVDGERYLPVNEEGNSVFEIPVSTFDEPMPVVGDTTAMSMPHEVEYELTFDSASVQRVGETNGTGRILPLALAAAVVCAGVLLLVAKSRSIDGYTGL